MFVIGMSSDAKIYFSTATVVIAIPTAIKIFN
jgi:heme/copper-type cytochrome/quinol oxidase subunit 1